MRTLLSLKSRFIKQRFTYKKTKTIHLCTLAADFQNKVCFSHSLGSVTCSARRRLRNLISRFLLKSCLVARHMPIVVLSGSRMKDAIASPSVYKTASSFLRSAIGILCALRSRAYQTLNITQVLTVLMMQITTIIPGAYSKRQRSAVVAGGCTRQYDAL